MIIGGRRVRGPQGVELRTYADGLHRFRGRARPRVDAVVVHETAGRTVEGTVRTLIDRKLGIHFIVGADGAAYQHAEPFEEVAHCKGHNARSLGIEVVSPYYPRLVRESDPWTRTIDAPWAHEGQYALPTLAQAEATMRLVAWLASVDAASEGLTIPFEWPGLLGRRFHLSPAKNLANPKPGIYAHMQTGGHADGAWLLLYAWMRIVAGMGPAEAYEEAARRATGARAWVDVGDLMALPPPVVPEKKNERRGESPSPRCSGGSFNE